MRTTRPFPRRARRRYLMEPAPPVDPLERQAAIRACARVINAVRDFVNNAASSSATTTSRRAAGTTTLSWHYSKTHRVPDAERQLYNMQLHAPGGSTLGPPSAENQERRHPPSLEVEPEMA